MSAVLAATGKTWPTPSDMKAAANAVRKGAHGLERLHMLIYGLIDVSVAPSLPEDATHPGAEFVGWLSMLTEDLGLDLEEMTANVEHLRKVRDALAIELLWPDGTRGGS